MPVQLKWLRFHERLAHFFVSEGGSKIRERVAHFFIDIHIFSQLNKFLHHLFDMPESRDLLVVHMYSP